MTNKDVEFSNPEAVAEIYEYAASLFRPLSPEHQDAGEAAGESAATPPPEKREAETEGGNHVE